MSDNNWHVPDIDDGFRILVKSKIRENRINICRNCSELNSILFCSQCNCFMPVATWIEKKHCKLKKW